MAGKDSDYYQSELISLQIIKAPIVANQKLNLCVLLNYSRSEGGSLSRGDLLQCTSMHCRSLNFANLKNTLEPPGAPMNSIGNCSRRPMNLAIHQTFDGQR